MSFYEVLLDYWVVLRNRAQQAKKRLLLKKKKKVINGYGLWEIKRNAFSIKCVYGCDCMCIRKIVYLHSPHVFLSKCLSVSLPARAHGSAWRPAKRIEDGEKQKKKKKKKVLSVSAAWAGSWWEREGRRLAGRSHALFRHHSYGARPLGQNTTWFWITRTHKLENHTHLPQLPQLLQLFHVFLRIANSISLLCDSKKVEPIAFCHKSKLGKDYYHFFFFTTHSNGRFKRE